MQFENNTGPDQPALMPYVIRAFFLRSKSISITMYVFMEKQEQYHLEP